MITDQTWQKAIKDPFKREGQSFYELQLSNSDSDEDPYYTCGFYLEEQGAITAGKLKTAEERGWPHEDMQVLCIGHRMPEALAASVLMVARQHRHWAADLRSTLPISDEAFTEAANVLSDTYELSRNNVESSRAPHCVFGFRAIRSPKLEEYQVVVGPTLKGLRVFNVYRGPDIPKPIAYSFVIAAEISLEESFNEAFFRAWLADGHEELNFADRELFSVEHEGNTFGVHRTAVGPEFRIHQRGKHPDSYVRISYDFFGDKKPMGQVCVEYNSPHQLEDEVCVRMDSNMRIAEVSMTAPLKDHITFTDDEEVSPWLKDRDGC